MRALQRLGAEHALVVYGRDGMDEVSLGAATLVGELKNGEITEYEIHPEDFGLPMVSNRALKVDTPEQSRQMLLGVLSGATGAAHDIVCPERRRGAVCRPTWSASIQDGIAKARAAIASGAAKAKLEAPVVRTPTRWRPEAAMWSDPGLWIALGVSALFIVVAW